MKNNFSAGYTKTIIECLPVGNQFPLHVFYPSDTPEISEMIDSFSLDVAIDSAPRNGHYPLVIFSHGSGSMPLLFRTLGQYLARKGFVVGMPQHPGNNRIDNSLVDTIENLINRPIHLQAAINWFFDISAFKSVLLSDAVFLIGHSMGGYSALALAGGKPRPLAHENIVSGPLNLARDPRVAGIVLLAPATVWFREKGALDDVDIPILMYTGKLDKFAPKTPHADIVLEGINNTSQVIHKEVEHAGHFSFMGVYPDELKSEALLPSQDPVGFDRQIFLDKLYPEIAEFLFNAI